MEAEREGVRDCRPCCRPWNYGEIGGLGQSAWRAGCLFVARVASRWKGHTYGRIAADYITRYVECVAARFCREAPPLMPNMFCIAPRRRCKTSVCLSPIRLSCRSLLDPSRVHSSGAQSCLSFQSTVFTAPTAPSLRARALIISGELRGAEKGAAHAELQLLRISDQEIGISRDLARETAASLAGTALRSDGFCGRCSHSDLFGVRLSERACSAGFSCRASCTCCSSHGSMGMQPGFVLLFARLYSPRRAPVASRTLELVVFQAAAKAQATQRTHAWQRGGKQSAEPACAGGSLLASHSSAVRVPFLAVCVSSHFRSRPTA
eukprot:1724041-Pleurochrysis_carterae.AAC.1